MSHRTVDREDGRRLGRVIEERFDGLFERTCVTVLYTARRT